MGFVSDESHNHRIKIEEEHDEVEPKFDERFLRGVVSFKSKFLNMGRLPSCVC